MPNHALQRTAAGRRGCSRRVSWPPSLRLGRSAGDALTSPETVLGVSASLALCVSSDRPLGFEPERRWRSQFMANVIRANGRTEAHQTRRGRHSFMPERHCRRVGGLGRWGNNCHADTRYTSGGCESGFGPGRRRCPRTTLSRWHFRVLRGVDRVVYRIREGREGSSFGSACGRCSRRLVRHHSGVL